MIDHTIGALAAYVDTVVIIGREWNGRTIADLPHADLGPLGGIAAALNHARASGHLSILTIGCDMPRVPADLLAAIAGCAPSYCPDAPILGHWPASFAPDLIARLMAGGDRSVRHWAADIDATAITAAVPLANINTPGDLAP